MMIRGKGRKRETLWRKGRQGRCGEEGEGREAEERKAERSRRAPSHQRGTRFVLHVLTSEERRDRSEMMHRGLILGVMSFKSCSLPQKVMEYSSQKSDQIMSFLFR